MDAEPSMVALAARAVPAADVRQALLPELPFADGAFDVTVANFVVNHVGRPRAALTELCRVTRPGGRVAVTDWPSAAAPGRALLREAFEAAGLVRPPEVPAVAAADDFPRTEAGLAGLLTAAGLAEVSCRTLAWDHVVDTEVWWSGPASGIAALGQSLMRQPPEVVAEVRRHFDALAAGFRGGDGLLVLPHTALVATGVVVGAAPGCHLG